MTIFAYISQMLLLRFLVSMFNNKFQKVFENQDYLNRRTIINMKNSASYDKKIGAITTAFFPINMLLLILVFPIMLIKNDRFNDMVLKTQYIFLGLLYCLLAFFASLILMPVLFIK